MKNDKLEIVEDATLNIVVVTDTLDFSIGGGVGSFIFDLCTELLYQPDVKVYLVGVVSQQLKEDPMLKNLKEIGANVIDLCANSRREAIVFHSKYVIKLRNVIKKISREDDTIVNVHLKLGVLIGALATLGLKRVKCVETYHNTYKNYHLQCWTLSSIIKRYICVSATAGEEMHRRFLTPYRKIKVIPNGVNRQIIREKAGVDENIHFSPINKLDPIKIVSVGRLSYEKNILFAASALRDVQSIDYTIIGDGPQLSELENIIKGKQNFHVVGAKTRNETLQMVSNSDIVVMPSLWEGRSIFMLEALALDKVLIISDAAGLREPFEEKELDKEELFRITRFGCIVRTNDKESYIAAVRYLQQNYNSVAINMKNYISKISKENDMVQVAKQYMEVFNSIV